MFDNKVELGQGLHSSSQYPFRQFKCQQPFQTVMVGPQNNFISEQIMPEMLKRANDCQQLSSSRTIVPLGHIHDPREECNQPLNTINPLRQNRAHSNVRGVRVQGTRFLTIKRLLGFFRPFKSGHFFW